MRPSSVSCPFLVVALLGLLGVAHAGGGAPATPGFTPAHLFVVDHGDPGVVELALDGSTVRRFGGADLVAPTDLAFDGAGRLLVADAGLDRVVVFDATGAVVATWGEGAALDDPWGLALADDGAWVSCRGDARVVKLNATGALDAVAPPELVEPVQVHVGPQGHLYVADAGADVLHVVDPSGSTLLSMGPGDTWDAPSGLAAVGDELLVCSPDSDSLHTLAPGNAFQVAFGGVSVASPADGVLAPDGRMYVVYRDRSEVGRYEAESYAGGWVPASVLDDPTAIAVSPWRWKAKLRARREQADAVVTTHGVPAELSWAPGSGLVSLTFGDNAAVFPGRSFAFRGWESIGAPTSPRRVLSLASVPRWALTFGATTLTLEARGKVDPSTRLFSPRKLKGALGAGGLGLAVTGAVTTSKVLP